MLSQAARAEAQGGCGENTSGAAWKVAEEREYDMMKERNEAASKIQRLQRARAYQREGMIRCDG